MLPKYWRRPLKAFTDALPAPLGSPANLQAHQGDRRGAVLLTRTPGANATLRRIGYRSEGAAEPHHIPRTLPGNAGAVNFAGLAAGRWRFFIVIAAPHYDNVVGGARPQWRNWAGASVA